MAMLWTFETINATSKYYCFICFIVLSPDSLKNTIVVRTEKSPFHPKLLLLLMIQQPELLVEHKDVKEAVLYLVAFAYCAIQRGG